MKLLFASLLILASVAVGRAASTETAVIDQKIVDVDAKIKALVEALNRPAEEKVVELHMTRNVTEASEEKKRKSKKIDVLPLGYGVCSGEFVTATGDILTAKHCTEGFDSIEVVTFDQQHYAATVVYKSPNHDLAMIHIDRLDTAYFNIAPRITRGEKVYALGSPLGITSTLSTGIVAKLDGDITLVDCSVLPGNSGCPLINSDGELVGTVTAGFIVGFGTTHLNIAQSLNVVRFFLFDAYRSLADKRR